MAAASERGGSAAPPPPPPPPPRESSPPRTGELPAPAADPPPLSPPPATPPSSRRAAPPRSRRPAGARRRRAEGYERRGETPPTAAAAPSGGAAPITWAARCARGGPSPRGRKWPGRAGPGGEERSGAGPRRHRAGRPARIARAPRGTGTEPVPALCPPAACRRSGPAAGGRTGLSSTTPHPPLPPPGRPVARVTRMACSGPKGILPAPRMMMDTFTRRYEWKTKARFT
ncbi:basic proline-rich protein-like [Harpia harpyja]|uniref:basic proline-rich protein-like n=1 Tax=Harpia harpyja TaxID=202280 RepID=UPI0022B214F8|nr:basic proline-rich protein-like [Harpia harpyja]